MSLKKYISYKRWQLVYMVVVIGLVNTVLYSSLSIGMENMDLLYLNSLILLVSFVYLIGDFLSWRKKLLEIHSYIDDKSSEEANTFGDSLELEIVKKLITKKDREREEDLEALKGELDELNDFITRWVHEIKIPITILELIRGRLEDEGNYKEAGNVEREKERLEFLVSQVLYTSRSTGFEEDLYIEKVDLEREIKNVVKKSMGILIGKNIEVKLDVSFREIYTDRKWLNYTLNQMVNNACKYSDRDSYISFYIREKAGRVYLYIENIGEKIDRSNVDRIFDRGFTGKVGRKYGMSTGMGLYISKKMSKKLNYDIYWDSSIEDRTVFVIEFYDMDQYFNVTRM